MHMEHKLFRYINLGYNKKRRGALSNERKIKIIIPLL